MTVMSPKRPTQAAVSNRQDVLKRYLRELGPSDTTLAPSMDEDMMGDQGVKALVWL